MGLVTQLDDPCHSNFTIQATEKYSAAMYQHGILATRGRFTENGENQVFPKSILWSQLVFQGAGSTSDVLVCNLNNLRAGHRLGGLSK